MKSFIMIVTLWSGLANANIYKKQEPGFAVLSSDFKTDEDDFKKEITNLPRVRSQDSIPACFGFTSATVAQYQVCKKKNVDCANDSSVQISPLSTMAWANTNTPDGGVADADNHSNIQWGVKGSVSVNALRNASVGASSFYNESCYPFDQFANKYGNFAGDKVDAVVEKMKSEFLKFKNDQKTLSDKKKTEGEFCEKCFIAAAEDFKIKMPINELKEAMRKRDTFGEFLYDATIGPCGDFVKIRPRPNFDSFPKEGAPKYPDMVDKIKEVLGKDNPLSLDGICIKYSGTECETRHSVVITGYRKMCKGLGKDRSCRDVLRVQNSWGKDWQNDFGDGWVDAKELLSSVKAKQSLSWYF